MNDIFMKDLYEGSLWMISLWRIFVNDIFMNDIVVNDLFVLLTMFSKIKKLSNIFFILLSKLQGHITQLRRALEK